MVDFFDLLSSMKSSYISLMALPRFSQLNLCDTKKTWESVLAYPSPQAFALPNPKDKQRKKPTPRDIIYVRQ